MFSITAKYFLTLYNFNHNLIFQLLIINYVRDSVNTNETETYRLMKPVVFKYQVSDPGELYKLRFINVSSFRKFFQLIVIESY